jgi:hypothetical protein
MVREKEHISMESGGIAQGLEHYMQCAAKRCYSFLPCFSNKDLLK